MNPDNEEALAMLDWLKTFQEQVEERENDPEWQKHNLEYDLRTSEFMLDKVRNNEFYAQNLYAAMCNNEFTKNEPWTILKEQIWSCSWRYAGGILADMVGKGDYIDYYCSGIQGDWSDEDYSNATEEDRAKYLLMKEKHVGESCVTDEVREDLLKLGWIVVNESN